MYQLEEPDKGYAWVVAFAACVVNMILSGITRMIGILYVAIIDEYEVTRQEASLPFTVRNAIRYLSGPIVGVLGQIFGIRAVTFMGGIVAAAGSILSCFAPTVPWITVFWGLIHGLGFSLGNTLFQVVVNQYFEKYRATASGIVLSGACIGSFVYPIMMESILDYYGIFGCFLLLGGIFLNVLPPSLILKSPLWIEHPELYKKRKQNSIKSNGTDIFTQIPKIEAVEEEYKKYSRSLSNCSIQELDVFSFARSSQSKYPDFRLPFSRKLKLGSGVKSLEKDNVVCTLYNITENATSKTDFSQKTEKFPEPHENKFLEVSNIKKCFDDLKKDEFNTQKKDESDIIENFLQSLKDIVFLYRNPVYILISLGVASYFWVFLPILTVVVDYSRDKGIPGEYEKYLFHALTVGDLVGRLGFGWVTDKKILSFPIFMMLTFIFQGLFASLFPFATDIWLYMTGLVLYGITAGIVFVHFPVLVYKYIDQTKQSLAVGCVGLISGLVTFGIPPVIGIFRDQVGSYDGLFFMIGLISMITGSLWLLEPLFMKIARRLNA